MLLPYRCVRTKLVNDRIFLVETYLPNFENCLIWHCFHLALFVAWKLFFKLKYKVTFDTCQSYGFFIHLISIRKALFVSTYIMRCLEVPSSYWTFFFVDLWSEFSAHLRRAIGIFDFDWRQVSRSYSKLSYCLHTTNCENDSIII